jgi:hypothetical protein
MFTWFRRQPTIYVVERQSPDWAALDARYFDEMRAFARMIGRPENMMVDYVRLWDATFPLTFFQVRARLKDIATATRQQMHGVQIIDLDSARSLNDDNALLLFTDDDDWFAPDIAEHLKHHSRQADKVVIWRSLVLRKGFERRGEDCFCYTNNYALRGQYAQAHRDDFARVAQHWLAQDTITREAPVLRYIDLPLSITNRHPASTVELERGLGANLDAHLLRELVATWVHNLAVVETSAVPWSQDHVAAIKALFRELIKPSS